MTDRELLEAAAKAAGIDLDPEGYIEPPTNGYFTANDAIWAPFSDDGDALRLAVKLNMGMDILGFNRRVFVHAQGAQASVEEPHGSDPYAATRRAIVRAAASLPPQQTA